MRSFTQDLAVRQHPLTRRGRLIRAALLLGAVFVSSAPLALAAFPGVNGRIVFSSSRTGILGVYIMNSDGTNTTALTDLQQPDFNPEFSPDGSKIVFVRQQPDFSNADIYVMNADGSGVTPLTDDPAHETTPSWSPDGLEILFTRSRPDLTGEIWVMDADGANQTPLISEASSNFDATWSPDGTLIAFTSTRDGGKNDIFLVNADGTNPVNLTNDPSASDFGAEWSPDGTQIAFVSDRDNLRELRERDVYVMNADGSDVRRLTDAAGIDNTPAWSPDGALIAFDSSRDSPPPPERRFSNIYVMLADGSGQTNLTLQTERSNFWPDWESLAPEEATDDLIGDVQALIDLGVLNGGQGNALIAKLDGAIKSLDKGDIQGAIDRLQSFVDQVTDFIATGVLTAEEGDPLIARANEIIAVLSMP